MNTERKLLGRVGVDSGQLMVCDPCYIDSQWRNDDHPHTSPLGVQFWGRDAKIVAELIKKQGIQVTEENDRVFFIPTFDPEPVISLLRQYRGETPDKGYWFVDSVKTTSTYDQIRDQTGKEEQGGSIPYFLGHEGFAVAFRSGLGDGVYDVYAHYADIEGWGRRITKVEIELITEEMLKEEEEE
jgi:hypothetical protein